MSSLWKEEGAAPGKEAVLQVLKQDIEPKAKWENMTNKRLSPGKDRTERGMDVLEHMEIYASAQC